MAPRYPSIPEPTLEPTSLRDSILSIKQMLEILTGQRGNADYAAVMPGEFNNSIDSVNSTKVSKSGDTMTGTLTISGGSGVGLVISSETGNVELGKPGTTNTPYIDFHSSASVTDYDVRLIASDGAAVSGHGSLRIAAGAVRIGDAGGSDDHLSIVNQRLEHTSLGLFQLGVGQWSWGMITGSHAMRLRWNGLAGTDVLTVDSAGDLQWTGAPWTAYTPTVNITGGAGTATGRYKKLGKTVALKLVLTVTTSGTVPLISLPFTAAGSDQHFLVGRENLVTGYTHIAIVQGVNAFVIRYDNSNAVTAGWQIHLSGVYEAA